MISTSGYPASTEHPNTILSLKGCKAPKTHDYSRYQQGVDYFLEFSHLDAKVYMTGQGKGVKPNDYILLKFKSTPQRYQVEMIDYYSAPSDLWIALLNPIA